MQHAEGQARYVEQVCYGGLVGVDRVYVEGESAKVDCDKPRFF